MIGIIITPLALYQENNGWPNELPCTWWVGLGEFKETKQRPFGWTFSQTGTDSA